jgi:predicted transposase YbfD/YdcC
MAREAELSRAAGVYSATLRHNDALHVRPITSPEESLWNDLMGRHHYLGFQSIVGESMKYVAILDGTWVGLIGWGTAAFKSGHRDKWIGWAAAVQYKRLKFIANNVRFLILPGKRIKNLASRILSLNLKRLSLDWEAVYGHPIILAETFVDMGRFQGTCYRAAGWSELGSTRGYRRNGGKYYYHGNTKTIFIRPLRRDAAGILSDPLSSLNGYTKEGIVDINALSLEGKGGLIEHLRMISEPRKARGIRHGKISILAVAICALLSGAKGFNAIGEWAAGCSQSILRKLWCRWDRRKKKYIPPSEPTIRRLLQQVDAVEVDRAVGAWLMSQVKGTEEGAIAIDGKTLKGARQLHLLSAFLHHEGIAIAQKEVAAAGGEIQGLRQMLKDMDIGGMVVTADALHTQKETAAFVVEGKGADYFFTVKENQSALKNDIESLQWDAFPPSA